MNIKLLVGAITVLILLIGGFLFVQNYMQTGGFFAPTTKVTIDNHVFNAIIAKTSKEKQVGLSSRTSLPKDSAMLFPFPEANYYPFWMKNMNFSIDMLFINKDKIVTIYENLQPAEKGVDSPPTYQPTQPADKVLEISAGLVKEYKIKNGDTVTIAAKDEDLRN